MAHAAQEEISHCDMDHRLGDVDARLAIAHEAPPSNEPSKGSLDHPASRQYLEALFGLDPLDDFDDELHESGLVHKLGAIVGLISEEMLEPCPALADGIEDRLGPGAVGDVGRGQVDHQQAPVRVHRHVSLAPCGPLAAVKAALGSVRGGLHCLASLVAARDARSF